MNQKPFFKDSELNKHDSLLIDEIESLPLDRQQDAIAMLFGAMVSEYKAAPEKANPFVKFFAEMAIVQDAETETPRDIAICEAAVTGKINTSFELTANHSNVNQ